MLSISINKGSLWTANVGVIRRTLDIDCFFNAATTCALRIDYVLEVAQIVWIIHRATLGPLSWLFRPKGRDVSLMYGPTLSTLADIGLSYCPSYKLRRQLSLGYLPSSVLLTIYLSACLLRRRISNHISLLNFIVTCSFVVDEPLWWLW